MIDEQIEVGEWVLYRISDSLYEAKVKAFSCDGKYVKLWDAWRSTADWHLTESIEGKVSKRKYLRW